MLFTPEEAAVIVSALETYDDALDLKSEPGPLHELCVSAASKLNSLSIFTAFTEQEFSVMTHAAGYVCKNAAVSGYVLDELGVLYLKLLDLSAQAQGKIQ